MTLDNSDKFTRPTAPSLPLRLHFPKLTKSTKPAAISALTTLSFPKTYKCLEWAAAQIHFLKLTNPDTAVRSRWGAGILMPPPTVSAANLPPTILCSHCALEQRGQNFILYYPAGGAHLLLLQSHPPSQHDVLARFRLVKTPHWSIKRECMFCEYMQLWGNKWFIVLHRWTDLTRKKVRIASTHLCRWNTMKT